MCFFVVPQNVALIHVVIVVINTGLYFPPLQSRTCSLFIGNYVRIPALVDDPGCNALKLGIIIFSLIYFLFYFLLLVEVGPLVQLFELAPVHPETVRFVSFWKRSAILHELLFLLAITVEEIDCHTPVLDLREFLIFFLTLHNFVIAALLRGVTIRGKQ